MRQNKHITLSYSYLQLIRQIKKYSKTLIYPVKRDNPTAVGNTHQQLHCSAIAATHDMRRVENDGVADDKLSKF